MDVDFTLIQREQQPEHTTYLTSRGEQMFTKGISMKTSVVVEKTRIKRRLILFEFLGSEKHDLN